MKKRYISILVIMIMFIFSLNAYAEGKNDSYNLFLFRNSISNNDVVYGDIYAFAKDISVNNIVGGDIISAGQQISVNSKEVKGNIRLAGQDLYINVEDTKNITAAAQNIDISKGTKSNAIYAASKDFKFQGQTNELSIKAKDVIIDGTINNDLNIECENITIGENAKLLGKINIKSPNEATVYGKHNLENAHYEKVLVKESNYSFRIIPIITSFVSSIVIGFLLLVLFKNYFNNCIESISLDFGKYILIGLCVFIAFPILFLLLCISIIGIPISLLLLMLYILLIYLSHIIVGIIIGKFILKGYSVYLQLIAGICVVKFLIYIPFIGFILGLCAVLFTLGLLTFKIYSRIR